MKTEKKPNEPSCCPPSTVVKEEPDADPVKIKEEGASGNNDDTTGEDATECPRDPCLEPSNGEGTMSNENQNTNGNQQILNSVKQEGDPNNPTDDLPGKQITCIILCIFPPNKFLSMFYLYASIFFSYIFYIIYFISD
jgi:hypothetical protein